MKVVINKSIAKGTIVVPPSKSYAHRYIIAGMLASNNMELLNVEYSNDILETLNAALALGSSYIKDEDKIIFKNLNNLDEPLVLNVLESGSTLRFLIPLSMVLHNQVIIYGSEKLFSRGLEVYEEIFKEQGITYFKTPTSLKINGSLGYGNFKINGNISSQYITGLLFALPLLNGDSTIDVIPPIESKPYIDITLDVLKKFGIKIDVFSDYQKFVIKGQQKYVSPKQIYVEGDYSNAAFLEVYNYFSGSVLLEGLSSNSCQGDKVYKEYFKELSKGFTTIDLGNAIDLGPIMFVFASLKHGAHFVNTARLRIKESDRISDMASELAKIGAKTMILDNEVYIYKANNLHNVVFNSHNDHRIAMALTIIATIVGGEIIGAEAVNKSYPSFYDDIKSLGIEVMKCK